MTSGSLALAEGGLQPSGPDFQVNSSTPGAQTLPAIATSPGGFVVAWESFTPAHDTSVIFARRFDDAGAPLGGEFQVSSYTGYERFPAVAREANGDFVIAWTDYLQDSAGTGIFARRFGSAGAAIGGEFQVNSYTPGFQLFPVIASDSDGDFVVAWQSNSQDFGSYGVFARRFDSSGAALAAEFRINAYTPGAQKNAAVAMDAAGSFIVVWSSLNQDFSHYGIFARRFDPAGVPLAAEFQVNTYTYLIQDNAAIGLGADGAFVIVWRDYTRDGSNDGVFGRRFDSSGVAQAVEFQVTTYTSASQKGGRVAIGDDGEFVVAWQGTDAYDFSIFARRFSSAGTPFGGELEVNMVEGHRERSPAIAANDGGTFVVAWDSYGQDTASYGIFARRLTTGIVLDVDGDGEVQALTDGILVLRYAFDFTGNALVNGAVAGGCARCDAPAILAYLDGLGLVLDVDGDGEIEPLTDGLLILRFEFGFTGAALISGAVAEDCTRCDATMIEDYLQPLD